MTKILFIDRDGTLIDEPISDQQVDRLDKLRFEPDVIPALLKLSDAGYQFVIVTNQDGLGTEAFPKEDFETPHQRMLETFESQGIVFDDVLICPHRSSDNCACRKPLLGLVRKYLDNSTIDFSRSFVIGDRETDMEFAGNMGLNGIQYDRVSNGWRQIATSIISPGRVAEVERITNETTIRAFVDLDQSASNNISTGIGFFDHMVDQIATHGGFHLTLSVAGDLDIDDHHTIEDAAIVLGEALKKALGDKAGIGRFGFALPMDESKAECLLDLSGRPFLKFSASFNRDMLGEMSTEMVPHFFRSLAHAMMATVHLSAEGENTHHVVESLFKCFGRALRQATMKSGTSIPSSKGVL